MIHFSYSFCMAMLHSFWQAGLLLLLYVIVDKLVHRNNAPLAKRNILYITLLTQLVLSAITFSVYFFDAKRAGITAAVTETLETFVGVANLRAATPWIFSLYVFVIAHKFIQTLYTWRLFKQQYKNGLQKPMVDLRLFTQAKANQFGINRKVNLWLSNNIQTPVTFGFFKPVILLPVALINNISVQQAETLILHELAHIRTNDYLLNWFLLSAESLFFFNPFVINFCKKIRLEREKNCDVQVMGFEYSPALYAETLLYAERMKQLVPVFQLAAVNQKKQLLQRIQYFTNKKVIEHTLRFNIVAPLIGLFLLFLLSTAILFQSGGTSALPSNAALPITYPPYHNYLISDGEYGSDVIPQEPEVLSEKNRTIVAPAIIPETAPAPQPEMHPEDIIQPKIENNFATPIAAIENDAAKQIIVQEEGSGSASVKIYYLSFENGKWILQPEYVITAREIKIDSFSRKIDSLSTRLKRVFPAQQ